MNEKENCRQLILNKSTHDIGVQINNALKFFPNFYKFCKKKRAKLQALFVGCENRASAINAVLRNELKTKLLTFARVYKSHKFQSSDLKISKKMHERINVAIEMFNEYGYDKYEYEGVFFFDGETYIMPEYLRQQLNDRKQNKECGYKQRPISNIFL
jgi:hypothetical protein